MSSVERAKQLVLQRGLARGDEIEGCTEQEVAQVESRFGVTLPGVYREFLLTMGCGAGQFFLGTDMFFPTLLKLRDAAVELLESEGANFSLSGTDFVFLMHQGYQFSYFDTAAGEDPPVWMYVEEDAEPSRPAGSFSGWLLTSVDEHSDSDGGDD